MQISQYQPLALRTEKQLPTPLERLAHASLGFITEIGEIATIVKRIAIYGKTLDALDKDGVSFRTHAAEEIGDVCWYLAVGASALGRDIFAGLVGDLTPDTSTTLSRVTRHLAIQSGRIAYVVEELQDQGIYDVIPSDVQGVAVSEELACMAQELVNLCEMLDIPLSQILGENIAKLQERFPDAYSDVAAEARADKGGLDARNS